MTRIIIISLMALPIFLGNAASSLAVTRDAPILSNKFLLKTDLITSNIKELIHLVPFQLSARDDQTEDCLRAGDCKY